MSERDGAGARSVVLVHGTRADAGQWDAYRELLPDLNLIAVDLPGHGHRGTESFTGEAALDTISAAVEQAGPHPVLVGHSLGGYLAMVWAQRNPEALAALIPIGATGDPTTRVTEVYRTFAKLSTRVDHERLAARTNLIWRRLGAANPPTGTAGYAALPAAWQFVFDHARPSLLADLACPVVLLNGQFDQMRLHVRRFEAAARDARVVTVPRATHLLPNTHPSAVTRVLREIIAETQNVAVPPREG